MAKYPWMPAFSLLLLFCAEGVVVGDPQPLSRVSPADVLTEINRFRHDLEWLRRFVGEPVVSELDIGIRSTTPQDIYFQALTLFEKTNRFSFEVSRWHADPPPVPSGDIQLTDVHALIAEAHRLLKRIMGELQITPPPPPPASAGDPEAGDLFTTLLLLNRQLNTLLERPFSPSDVYLEVTLSVGYAARLLARYPGAVRFPPEPVFEPNQSSSAVYLRLIACLESIARIFEAQGFAVHEIDTRHTDVSRIMPSDTFLVASLIVSQLDFLYKQWGITKAPPEAIYPGRRFPAHVYQRAGLLLAQLIELEQRVSATNRAAGETHESAAPQR
jgi:hypothetical protein